MVRAPMNWSRIPASALRCLFAAAGLVFGGQHVRAEVDANRPGPVPDAARATQITFASHLEAIVHRRCAPCHRPGQSAPFNLLGYEDLRKRAKLIQQVLEAGTMPPWLAEPGHGVFSNDRRLTESEQQLFREWMAQGKVDFFRGSWLADYPDAENYFAVFYSKNGSPPNYTRFNNPQFDALYEKALAENDDAKRYELYHAMETIIIEEAPVVPLYYDEVLRFSQKNVEELTPNALNLLQLKRVKIKR